MSPFYFCGRGLIQKGINITIHINSPYSSRLQTDPQRSCHEGSAVPAVPAWPNLDSYSAWANRRGFMMCANEKGERLEHHCIIISIWVYCIDIASILYVFDMYNLECIMILMLKDWVHDGVFVFQSLCDDFVGLRWPQQVLSYWLATGPHPERSGFCGELIYYTCCPTIFRSMFVQVVTDDAITIMLMMMHYCNDEGGGGGGW